MRTRWERLGLRGTVLLSLPVVALLITMLTGAVRQYLTFRELVWVEPSVARFLGERLRSPLRLARVAQLRDQLDPEAREPAVLRLAVPSDAWRQFQSTPLAGWDEWFPGYVIRTGRYQDVEFRKRGDRGIHYVAPQKSMTIRSPKGESVAGVRALVLSRKNPVEQFLVHSLQARFDILAPATSLAPVFVNDRYYGMFRAIEPVDESFLRRAGRLPGNIHRLDTFAPDERFPGVEPSGALNERLWDRTAVNDRPRMRTDRSWFAVLRDLRSSNATQFQRAMARFDRRELASYLAFQLLVGDPFHASNIHNQFWYQDPSSGLFHPIAWDLYARELKDMVGPLPHLLEFLLRDPTFPAHILAVLDSVLDTEDVGAYVDSLGRDVRARFGRYIDYAAIMPAPEAETLDGAPERVVDAIHANATVLRGWIRDSRLAVAMSTNGPRTILDLQTRGRGPSELTGLRFDRSVERSGLRLVADQNRNGVLDEADRDIPLRWTAPDRVDLVAPEALHARWQADASFAPVGQHYRFFVLGAGTTGITLELVNPITAGSVDIEPWTVGQLIPGDPLFHPWEMERTVGRRYEWRGRERVMADRVFGEADTLVIHSGTVITLDPDASVVSHGPVLAVGSAARPIVFRAVSEEEPWGALALQGRSADGSVFRHVLFEGGGGAVVDGVEYSGMVNVHWTIGVVFDSVVLSNNQRSDDALHAVHADVRISGSRFERANADAIDFDFATGVVESSVFTAAANDAIDLMGSSPRIRANTIVGSGDKGISIGEASAPMVTDNVIEGGHIGIEVKDRSEPILLRNTVIGNTIGLSAYAKNWRYAAGGFARLVGATMEGNTTPWIGDPASRLTRPVTDAAAVADLVEHGNLIFERTYSGALWDARLEWFSGPDTEMEVDQWDLVVRERGRSGGAVAPIQWDLTDSTVTYHLLVEYRVSQETKGVFRVVGATGPRELVLTPADSAFSYHWAAIDLPRDRYTRLDLEVDPPEGGLEVSAQTGLGSLRSGHVRIHRYSLYSRAVETH